MSHGRKKTPRERTTSPPPPQTDAFTAVLGARRGTGAAREHEPIELTPADRARQFVQWVNSVPYAATIDYFQAERQQAQDLDLVLQHGNWMQVRDGDHEPWSFTLTAVYYGKELVGFIEPDETESRLLLYDDRRPRARK